jgi:hypothetical protein
VSKESLIDRLLALPHQMVAAELQLLEAETSQKNFAAHLQTCEDVLLLGGSLDGKNAETREAQKRAATTACREGVDVANATVAAKRLRVQQLQTEFSSLKAIARLLAAE